MGKGPAEISTHQNGCEGRASRVPMKKKRVVYRTSHNVSTVTSSDASEDSAGTQYSSHLLWPPQDNLDFKIFLTFTKSGASEKPTSYSYLRQAHYIIQRSYHKEPPE